MASNSSSTSSPTPATCQSNFEQGVALALHLWPALSLAVQNHWGGPDSEDKRDWFAGAIVELFPDLSKTTTTSSPSNTTTTQPQQQLQPQQKSNGTAATAEEPEQVDVESVLLQVMLDEFEVNVDDESAFEVAEQVMRVRAECARGKFDDVAALRRRFDGKTGDGGGGGKVAAGLFKKVEDQDDDTDWDTDSDEDDGDSDDDEDVHMGDAPPAVKEKEAPEVDEEGFTKVTRKKR